MTDLPPPSSHPLRTATAKPLLVHAMSTEMSGSGIRSRLVASSSGVMGIHGADGLGAAQRGATVQHKLPLRKCGDLPQLGGAQEVWLLDLADIAEPFSAESVMAELGWSRGMTRDRLNWFKSKQMLAGYAHGHRWTSHGRAVMCDLLLKEQSMRRVSR